MEVQFLPEAPCGHNALLLPAALIRTCVPPSFYYGFFLLWVESFASERSLLLDRLGAQHDDFDFLSDLLLAQAVPF